MKKLICVPLLLAFISPGLAQKATERSALESLVDTERAFARMSQEKGTRPAFMAFIAEDGILFRPTAVKGKQWMIDHPLPPSDKRPLLSWQPMFAEVARAGDMGYTTGPWEYKDDIHDAKPTAFGNFVTVWKRQADGEWKFAIDLGISHPEPVQPVQLWDLPTGYKQPSKGRVVNVKAARTALLARDRDFFNASSRWGILRSFQIFAADDVRLFGEGKLPVVSKERASVALSQGLIAWSWQPTSADVSRSGDLGYTHGLYQLKSTTLGNSLTEKGNYLRIWKKQNGIWKVVLDLANPRPPEEKKN
ncbi:MAG TPA: hypothetical protein DCK93_04530 [Blastocatellia bacterium]|jgi:ketosteroid isomerase-like protein|nr:hypothetical protein [Blastocatellia bacterium]HAF22172.1 hypothetical protein [Blastocatellia bacterium]